MCIRDSTGATLSAATGTQRIVLTSLTSGTMVDAATDADLAYNASDDRLIVNNLDISGITTLGGPVTAGSSEGAVGQYLRHVGTGVTWANFPTLRTTSTNTATAGQTTFNFTYNTNFLDVFVNGVKLSPSEYTATNGSQIILNTAAFADEIVEFHSYNTASTYGGGGGGSYGNSDVDNHLNVSGASSGQILSWNGSDYAWVADQTGGSGITTAIINADTLNVSGITTLSNVTVGLGATELIVNGDARVTGILTVGPASVTIDGINNEVSVGAGITLYGNTGIISATSVNVTGESSVSSLSVSGNSTLTGSLSIAGLSTFTDSLLVDGASKTCLLYTSDAADE